MSCFQKAIISTVADAQPTRPHLEKKKKKKKDPIELNFYSHFVSHRSGGGTHVLPQWRSERFGDYWGTQQAVFALSDTSRCRRRS